MDESDGKFIDDLLKKYYTKLPGESSKGRGIISAQVPEQIHRLIQELASSPTFPEYKTLSDVIKDCFYVGYLIRTNERFKNDKRLLGLRAGIEALSIGEQLQFRRATVDKLCTDLMLANSKTEDSLALMQRAEEFLSTLEGTEAQRLGDALTSFRNR